MSDAAIVVRGLGKQFGDVTALDGVDFEVPRGTVVALLGPNGAGKTTTVRVLTTILRADRGEATVLGYDVARQPHAVRSVLGLAGQHAAVDEILSGRENLYMVGLLTRLSIRDVRRRAAELLERFDLTDAADRAVRTYSGGMRRRLDVAAALVHRPPVLMLDEPTTGLDPHSRNEVWSLLAELVADGTTILLTTQYLDEADRLARGIVVVDHGRVIASGSPADLKRQLDATVIEVELGDELIAAAAARALADAGPVSMLGDDRTVAVSVSDGGAAVHRVVRLLDRAGFTAVNIAIRQPSLEDVFLHITGRPGPRDRTLTPVR